jgi:lipopolysaccharide export system permease protein
MLIFVLQAIWLYIKELAGKDLDVVTIFKFLFYITPTLIPLILPLTILLSSIMVFGTFAENYEFAAMKSTGISLQRAMASLSIFIVLLSLITFVFSNNIIPWAEFESHNLRKNIAKKKPAMIIAEGQFNNIGEDFNIKVSKKSGENGEFLKDIIIHQKSGRLLQNHIVTIANNGELLSSKDSNILQLILFDGYYYDDTPAKNRKDNYKPLVKTYFKKYIKNLDLSQLNKIDLDEKNVKDRYSMLDIVALNYSIDSLKSQRTENYKSFSNSLYKRTNLENLDLAMNVKKDSVYNGEILDLFDYENQTKLLDYAINTLSTTKSIIKTKKLTLNLENSGLNKHGIALHKKFALAIACIILFFVGAPLGALIRKGGLGLPMVIAIVLFLTYHFMGLFAENSSESGSLNPVLAAWFSTLIMLPLSIFLTTRAKADRGIFEFDHITSKLKKWFKIESKQVVSKRLTTIYSGLESEKKLQLLNYQSTYKTSSIIVLVSWALLILTSIGLIIVNQKNNPLLPSILKQLLIILVVIYVVFYFKSDLLFSKIEKQIQLKVVTKKTKLIGFFIYPLLYSIQNNYTQNESSNIKEVNKDYTKTRIALKDLNEEEKNELDIYKTDFNTTSKITYTSYIIATVLFLAYFILKNNKHLPLATASINISGVCIIIYTVFLFKSEQFIKQYRLLFNRAYPSTGQKLLGILFYPYLHKLNKKSI